MQKLLLTLHVICHEQENGAYFGRVVGYPELKSYASTKKAVVRDLTSAACELLQDESPDRVSRRHALTEPWLETFALDVRPPKNKVGWQDEIELTFCCVRWDLHGAHVAYFPVLDIDVVATGSLRLEQLVDEHVRMALKRENLDATLESLVWIQRDVDVTIESVEIEPMLPTAKEFAMRESEAKTSPELPQVSTSLASLDSLPIIGMDETISRMTDILTAAKPRSVLLVGPGGVGKSAAFTGLYQQQRRRGLSHLRFLSTSGARLVAGMTGFGAWQQRCERICAEAEPDRVLLHLGNLAELNMVGRSASSDDGIAEVLAPSCRRGEILAVVECTPEQASRLEESHPDVLSSFARIDLSPPDDAVTRRILIETAEHLHKPTGVSITAGAVDELLRLHHRYATYSTSPGRPLRFLKNLLTGCERGETIATEAVTHAFADETGLPLFLLDDATPLDFEAMTDWFRGRILGQQQAIDVVTNLLGTVKAGLTRPGRPIASLLFVGPTGVGKTETAKALAEFLYRDPGRMVRIDMSEFADDAAVDRLVGGHGCDEGVLTSRVREQPFGVVLLDEFEKAHPRFFDMLLQVLGEGRLTDSQGRVADFRNSVIIMTSNLGTQAFDRGVIGMARRQTSADEYDETYFVEEVQKVVRPEFFNRIDRVVPFSPLGEEALTHVAQRELNLLSDRDGLKFRSVDLHFDESVLRAVVQQGYEPRYGARPIKRAIDRHVLAPLATALNAHPADKVLTAEMKFAGETLVATAKQATRTNGKATKTVLTAITRLQQQRRHIAEAIDCSKAQSVRNRIDRLEHEERQSTRRNRSSRTPGVQDVERSRELAALRPIEKKIQQLHSDVCALETLLLPDLFNNVAIDEIALNHEVKLLSMVLRDWLESIFLHGRESSDQAFLLFHGKALKTPVRLATALATVAAECRDTVTLFRVCPIPEKEQAAAKKRAESKLKRRMEVSELPAGTRVPEPVYWCTKIRDQSKGFEDLPDDTQAVALQISGPMAGHRYQGEGGVQEFRAAASAEKIFVEFLTDQPSEYERVSLPLHDRKTLRANSIRLYDEKKHVIYDKPFKRTIQWPRKDIVSPLADIIQERFDNMLYRQIRE